MLRSSGVAFVAAHRLASVGWYDIDIRLDYSCPAVSPLGVDQLATLTGTLCKRPQKISSSAYSNGSSNSFRQKDHLSDVSHRISGGQTTYGQAVRPVG